MLSKEESAFIEYWEKNRLRRKKVVRQFLLGVPLGLLFVIPIVLSLVSGWYKRADIEANSPDFDPRVLFVALLLIVGFTAIFWQRHQWDQYEQRYRELLARRERDRMREETPARGSATTAPDPASPSAEAPDPALPSAESPAPATSTEAPNSSSTDPA